MTRDLDAYRRDTDLDLSLLVREARQLSRVLRSSKSRIRGVAWYPFRPLDAIPIIVTLLERQDQSFSNLLRRRRVLDVGCGDGHLSFLFERLGCAVDAVDFSGTNYNQMAGVRSLRQALQSKIELHDIDVDNLRIPGAGVYDLTLLLGVLYHLKNPFGVMERLAGRTRYAIISSRVARWDPAGRTSFADLPVAYLLNQGELRGDITNYWIFSPSALNRLAERTGWIEICRVGYGPKNSDPVREDRDERVFCLLRSTVVQSAYKATPIRGLYRDEGGWCWSEQVFSFHISEYAVGPSARLRLTFTVPPPLIEGKADLQMDAYVNAIKAASKTYITSGTHNIEFALPPDLNSKVSPIVLEFVLNRAINPAGTDCRSLGVILSLTNGDYGLSIGPPIVEA